MKSVVVTGVSTGIGWGITKVLTKNGVHVFGSVRKPQDGERLKSEFGDLFTPLLFDVTDEAAVAQGARTVRDALGGTTLFGLVNNAGIAAPGPVLNQPIDEFRHQLEVNITGQVIVTQAFAPLLGVDKDLSGEPGRIVMISSVAGKNGAPFLGAYAASKHGLEGVSESLRRELMLFGIDVVIVGPGAVATKIWDKAEEVDVTQYQNSPFAPALDRIKDYMIANGKKGFPPEKLGRAVWKALTVANPKTRYAVVPGRLMNWTLPGLLPKRTVDGMMAGRLGLKKED
ncbi:MAG: SDR family NAD(P)-dependent oxidoreductase [Parvibaculaceae bacterium]|nr:SDR family NAD(P)-dependent oxidoreductase [Parvibaculaceae bacterium]HBM87306.1 oxidoreductase [Rhodobiaceae bacterium]|tara:strand:+ start:7628 stop:8482 length:855 start_codon:yes stop_codon:yes gene_type:complete